MASSQSRSQHKDYCLMQYYNYYDNSTYKWCTFTSNCCKLAESNRWLYIGQEIQLNSMIILQWNLICGRSTLIALET